MFIGKRQIFPPKKPGEKEQELYMGMSCKPVEVLGGFTLKQDDPTRYREKNTFITQDRAFPDEEYPEGADIDLELLPISAPGPSKPAHPDIHMKAKSKQPMIRMHSELLKIAKQLGIGDLCSADKETRAENVLQGITSKNLKCRYCDKVLSSVTHLKNHIKKFHLHVTAHKCEECNRYFPESSTLRRHQQIHDEELEKWKCTKKIQTDEGEKVCNKEFPSRSKLLDHQVVHQEGGLIFCQYCKEKGYKRQRGVKAHEDVCEANPNKKDRVKCRLCDKTFKERKSMLRHFRPAHPGEDPDI